MVRTPLTRMERERGRQLGALLRAARGDRLMTEVAAAAGVSAETLRKIESGNIPTPAFFTVVALARVLGLSLDLLAQTCAITAGDPEHLDPEHPGLGPDPAAAGEAPAPPRVLLAG